MTELSYNLSPGRTLGSNYHIIEPLGAGWEGEVYKVQENRTGVIRAAKLFYDREGLKQRPLLRYARKLYKLRLCPIIVQYHHHDTARIKGRNVDFLVSDFFGGEMLSNYLGRRKGARLPLFEALHLIYALALGIEQIHFLGEYHGDIHTDNIMVERYGLGFEVSLLDFLDLGRPTRDKIQEDVISLITILYEMIGGARDYRKNKAILKPIIQGRKRDLLHRQYRNAGDLRLALENLDWNK
nr:protein kinase [candidate division Zixibacteria bacterium]